MSLLLALLLSCNPELIKQQIHDLGYTDIKLLVCRPAEAEFTAADPHARQKIVGTARLSPKGKVEGVTVRDRR